MVSHSKLGKGEKPTPAKSKAGAKKARTPTGQGPGAKTRTSATVRGSKRPFPRLAVANATAKAADDALLIGTSEEQRIARVMEIGAGPGVTSMGELVRAGLPFSAFKTLEGKLEVTQNQLADFLSITNTTLARRRKEKRLNTEESDRLIRYARLLTQAQEMMAGDQAAASRWLNEPHPLLDDESPLEHAVTELGARDVEDLITRVQFGVYS